MNTMTKLETHLKRSLQESVELSKHNIFSSTLHLFQDAMQFFRYFQHAIVRFPMQVYISGLLFCPAVSYIREAFAHESPVWATMRSGLKISWPTALGLDVSRVHKLRWSPNEEVLLTYSRDGVLRLWDANSGQLLISIQKYIQDCVFSKDPTKLIILRNTCEAVEIWSATDGRLLETLPLQDSEQRLAISSTVPVFYDRYSENGCMAVLSRQGLLVARAWWQDQDESNVIEINSTESGLNVQKLAHYRGFFDLRFTPNMDHLAGADGEAEIYIWNIESGQIVWKLHLLSNVKPYLVFSHSSHILVNQDDALAIWDWSNDARQPLMKFRGRDVGYGIGRGIFHPDNSSVFVTKGSTIQRWQIREDEPFPKLGTLPSCVRDMAICEQGSKLAVASISTVKIWNLHGNSSKDSLENASSDSFTFGNLYLHNDMIYGVVSDDDRYGVWFSRLESPNHGIIEPDIHLTRKCVAGSKIVIHTSKEKGFKIRDLVNDAEVEHDFDKLNSSEVIAFGPGEMEVTIWDRDIASLWSCTLDGGVSDKWPVPESSDSGEMYISQACWSPDKLHLVLTHGENIHVWHAVSRMWTLVAEQEDGKYGDGSADVAFSPDGALFAVCSYGSGLRVFQTDGLKLMFSDPYIYRTSLLTFDDRWLKTDGGWFEHDEDSGTMFRHPPKHLYLEHSTQAWICLGYDRIIWLPTEYRSANWTASDSNIILGFEGPHIVVLDIQLHEAQNLVSRRPVDLLDTL